VVAGVLWGLRRRRRGLSRVAPDARFGQTRIGRGGWVRRSTR